MGPMRRPHAALVVLAAALTAGCPDPGPEPVDPPGDGSAPIASAGPAGPADGDSRTAADPLEGHIFTRTDVEELFAAERAGGDARQGALRKHGLIDARGQEVPGRVRAYERALQTLAEKDPAGWSDFLLTLER